MRTDVISVRRLMVAVVLGVGMIVIGTSTASAHTNNSSGSCAGVNASASGYELGDTNTLTVLIDGAQVFTVVDFGTSFNQTFPVPQDSAVHSWAVVIDSSDDQWDDTNSGSVGPCGTETTTTTTTSTTTTSTTTVNTNPNTAPTTESTTTTQPEGTTPTTTMIPDATSTTLPATLEIGSASSVCTNDVPFVTVTFGNQPEFNGHVGTITFVDIDGNVIEVHEVVYQAGETIRLLYPGASFDPVTGEATDWPGWMLNEDGFWVLDPSDAVYREGITIIAEINPTATTTITYPPETAACDSPEGPFPPSGTPTGSPPPAGQLPRTL